MTTGILGGPWREKPEGEGIYRQLVSHLGSADGGILTVGFTARLDAITLYGVMM